MVNDGIGASSIHTVPLSAVEHMNIPKIEFIQGNRNHLTVFSRNLYYFHAY